MARNANSSKRASCLKCGVLWFSTEPKDTKTAPAQPPSDERRVEGEAADPAEASANRVPSVTDKGKNPLEAFNKLKINVTVNRLVEKYWGDDIQSVECRKQGNKYFRQNKPKDAIKAYSKAIKLGKSNTILVQVVAAFSK